MKVLPPVGGLEGRESPHNGDQQRARALGVCEQARRNGRVMGLRG